MGVGDSQLIPVDHGSPRTHCMVAFTARHFNDEMLLMYGVRELKHVFEGAVRRGWTKGLQKVEAKHDEMVLFKLRGNPFHAGYGITASLTKSVTNTRFLVALLEDLMCNGWVLRAMVNLLRENKTESMVLARSQPESLKPMIAAVALCSSDMISLVNFPRHLFDTLVHLAEKHWPQGIKSTKYFNHEEDFGLQTKRWPFRSDDIGSNLHNSRMLLLNLIRAIYEVGYEFYGSGHPTGDIEAVGTLFFTQVEASKGAFGMFLMAPHNTDTIITVDAPDSCVGIVRQSILQNWSKQIQRENSHERLHAIKMNGNPFSTSGTEAVESVRVIIHTLQQFRRAGYRLAGTFDTTASIDDTSTFLLVQDAPKDITLMAVRLSGHRARNLVLVNAPAEVENAVRDTLHKAIESGIQEKSVDSALKFVLDRNVWNAQPVICNLIARIEAFGWQLVSSADLSSKYVQTKDTRFPIDLHTMFFERL